MTSKESKKSKENKEKIKQYRTKMTFYLITPNLILSIFLILTLPRNLSWIAGINLLISYIIYYVLVSKKKESYKGTGDKN